MTKVVQPGLAMASGPPAAAYVPPILIATVTCQWIDLQTVQGGAILANNPIDSALNWARAAPVGQSRYVRARVDTNAAANIPSWALTANGPAMTIVTGDAPGGLSVARWWAKARSTTTASVTLPQASIPIGSTAGFAASGVAKVGDQWVNYTSTDGTHLLGCTGGSGTIASGATVSQNPFRELYRDLMTKLAAKYDTDPNFALIFANLSMVEYAEPLMRFWTSGTGSPNIATYTGAGFTVTLDQESIHDCFVIHDDVWTNTPTGFAYNPYDGGGGSSNPTFAMTDQVATLGANTQLQNNSLGNNASFTSTTYTNMFASMAAAGGHLSFQTANPSNLAAGHTYYDACQYGITLGAELIELNCSPSVMTTPQLTSVDASLRANAAGSSGRPQLAAPDDGIPHRSLSGQLNSYLPSGTATATLILPDGTTHAATGKELAVIIANLYAVSSWNGDGSSEKTSGQSANMKDNTQSVTVGGVTYHGVPGHIILKYDKGYVEQSVGDAPTSMRTTPNETAANGRNIMQPGKVVAAVNGYTEWDTWHPHMRVIPQIDGWNGRYTTPVVDGPWFDTMGPQSNKGQQWWAGNPLGRPTGTAISDADWNALGGAMLDTIRGILGPDAYIALNGVRGGGSYQAYAALANHADQAMWEGWSDYGIGANIASRMTDTQFVTAVTAALQCQQKGCNFDGLLYLNLGATTVQAQGAALRAAQEWEVAVQLLASNDSAGGCLTMQMSVGSLDPWASGEMMNPLYLQFRTGNTPTGTSILGPPLDHYWDPTLTVSAGGPRDVACGTGYIYRRRYTNGMVLVNTGSVAGTTPMDGRQYVDLFTGAAVGNTITLQPKTARFLLATGGGSAGAPTVNITTPAASTVNEPVGTTTVTLTGTASDDTGVDHVDIVNYTLNVTTHISGFSGTPPAPILRESWGGSVANGWSTMDSHSVPATGWTVLNGATSTAAETGGFGNLTPVTGGAITRMGAGVSLADSEQLVRVRMTGAAPAAASWQIYIGARYADGSNYYRTILQLLPSGVLQTKIQKLVAGVASDVGGVFQTVDTAYAANRDYWVRFYVKGSTLQLNVWEDGTPEPAGWIVTATDTSLTAAGDLTLGALAGGSSGAVTMKYSSYSVIDPNDITGALNVNWSGSIAVDGSQTGPSGLGSNGVKVIAYDGNGTPSTAKFRTFVIAGSDTASPLVEFTTPDSSVSSGTTSLAVAGNAAAPNGSVVSVAVQRASDASIAATLGATTPARVALGAYLPGYAGGVSTWETVIGRTVKMERLVAPWNWASSITTQIQSDIAAGLSPVVAWDVPAASGGTSGAAQIANGSQDTIINAKIAALQGLGGTIYLGLGYTMDDGHTGTPAEFISAWTHVRGLITAAGATNLKLIWIATARKLSSGVSAAYWPGDSNVDAIGVEVVNTVSLGYTSPSSLLDPAVAFAVAHSSIPLLVTFSGSEEFSIATGPGSKAQWILDLGAWMTANAAHVAAWIWDEENTTTDNRIESSGNSFAAYKTATRDWTFTDIVAWTATVTNLQSGGQAVSVTATDNHGATSPPDTITVTRAAAPGVPAPTTPAPRITDTTAANAWVVGDLIHAAAGGFTNGPTSYTFRWYRGSNSVPFRTTTTANAFDDYTSGIADQGQTLRFDVVATNGSGSSAPVSSGASGVFTSSAPPPGVPQLAPGSLITITDVSE